MSDEIDTTTESIETSTTETSEVVENDPIQLKPVASEGKKNLGLFGGMPKPPSDLTEKKEVEVPKAETKEVKKEPVIVPPAYTPNYKFKVLDQEKEFDEWLKPMVKSKENEDRVRDLLTRAHGLTKIKSERDTLRAEYDTFKAGVIKDFTPVVQNYNQLSEMANSGRETGDWANFFQAAKIPVQSVIRWAANTVAKLEQDPNYLNQVQNTYQSTQKFNTLQQENQALKQNMERIQLQKQEVELEYALNAPEINQFAQMFDTRMGTPGALRQEIIRRGALIEMTEGRVASTNEIVGQIMKFYGGVPQAPVQASQEQVSIEGTQPIQQETVSKPVLPNVKGRSTSPAKSVIKSTDDLRNIRRSMGIR